MAVRALLWHWTLLVVLILHFFLIMQFLNEMHSEMPLNRWRHDGDSVNFFLVLFWYVAPIPGLFVSASAFNSSRLAGKQGAEFARITGVSWAIIWLTCAAGFIEAVYARMLIESDLESDTSLQRVQHRGWIVSELYTVITMIIFIVVFVVLNKRKDQLLLKKSKQEPSRLEGISYE